MSVLVKASPPERHSLRYPDHCYSCERPCTYAGPSTWNGALRCKQCLEVERLEAQVRAARGARSIAEARMRKAIATAPCPECNDTEQTCMECGSPPDDCRCDAGDASLIVCAACKGVAS